MIDEKAVRKMFAKAVNLSPSVPEKTNYQRVQKDKLYVVVQVLAWVLNDAPDSAITKRLEKRIESFEIDAKKKGVRVR